jgi:hypothetical protein
VNCHSVVGGEATTSKFGHEHLQIKQSNSARQVSLNSVGSFEAWQTGVEQKAQSANHSAIARRWLKPMFNPRFVLFAD